MRKTLIGAAFLGLASVLAAITPLCDAAWKAMVPFLREEFGNPSSLHSWAKIPREAVWTARETIAQCIGAGSPDEIFFTSGGTESDNWVINDHVHGKGALFHTVAVQALGHGPIDVRDDCIPVRHSGISSPGLLVFVFPVTLPKACCICLT